MIETVDYEMEIDYDSDINSDIVMMEVDNQIIFQNKIIEYISFGSSVIWFKGKDVTDALGYKSSSSALNHVSDENKIKYKDLDKFTLHNSNESTKFRCKPETILINDKGLESLCIKSRKPKSIDLCKLMEINVNQKYPCKEAEVLDNVIYFLEEKNIQYELQKEVNGYSMDMYLPDLNINIEIDENGHNDRCPIYESNREIEIKNELSCEIIRFDPDNRNDNIFKFIARLQNLISTKSL